MTMSDPRGAGGAPPGDLSHPRAERGLGEELVLEYDALLPQLHACEARLAEELAAVHRRGALALHSLSSRVKERESLLAKLQRPDRTYARLAEVTDVVALRVVTYFEDDLPAVASFVEERFEVELARSGDTMRRLDPSQFGYRSLHYVCRAPRAIAEPLGLPQPFFFEVQIRTILQHAWAEIEHDLGYKSRPGLPDHLQRRFSRLAGLIEIADAEFVSLRQSLAAYREEVRQRITSCAGEVALDPVSLACFVQGPEVAALDAALAERLGLAVGGPPFQTEYLLRMLRLAGFHELGELRRALGELGPAALALVAPYFRFTAAVWGFDHRNLDDVSPGYGLVFLAHAQLLRGAGLRLEELEKVTRFYRELDYPGDEATARRVAGALLEALGPQAALPLLERPVGA